MTFEPRVSLARELAKNYRLRSMADLSDGLGRDLNNICLASGVGAMLEGEQIPVHEDALQLAGGTRPLDRAISDGEDYELLVISPDALPPPCVRIGRIRTDPGIILRTSHAEMQLDTRIAGGWEHPL
jgi:thiamine-monophosphate kinase